MSCCIELTDLERDEQVLAPEKLTVAANHLRESGYLIVVNVMPSEPLDRLRARLDADWSGFNSGKRPWLGGGRIIGHLGIHPVTYPEFCDRKILANGTLLSITSRVLAGAVYIEGVGGNTNAPKSVPQEFHSDVKDWSAKRLLVNIPLCDVDERNGSLEAIPGTHHPDHQSWRLKDILEAHPPARVNTKLGSVVIRFPQLIHRGTANHSDHARHMLAMWHTTSAVRTGNATKSTLDPTSGALLDDYAAMAEEGMAKRLHSVFYPNYFPIGVRGMVKEAAYRYFPRMYRISKAVTGRAKHSVSLGG